MGIARVSRGLVLAAAALMVGPLVVAPLAARGPGGSSAASWGAPWSVSAQSQERAGTVAAGLLLRRLDGVKRVLMIAAHPDDEDTGFLTAVARGLGADAAYLSLTRGDGGQNLIGPELFEGLGVIRTGELGAARELDGATQLFTRAFDFGFSKTADESLTMWPREALLEDVVWAIRTFRPHVVVSVFSGTPSDGHGHHQAAGIIAREAFAVAGDPTRFPDQISLGLEPWAPAKLLQTSRRRFLPDAPPIDGEIILPIGGFDPLLGRSNFQVAMDSRSQHRSQDMGAAQSPGPRATSVILVDARVPNAGSGLFSGIDTTLVGLTRELPGEVADLAAGHLETYRSAVARAVDAFGLDPAPMVAPLVDALAALDRAGEVVAGHAGPELDRVLSHKRALTVRTMMAAAGVVFDVRAQDDIVVPGETVQVEALLWNGGPLTVRSADVALRSNSGWPLHASGAQGLTAGGDVAPGTLATWRFEVDIPAEAAPSKLYYMSEARDGAMYRWGNDARLWGLPRDPAEVVGELSFAASGGDTGVPGAASVSASHEADWRYVGVDQALGEFVEPVLVVPRVSVNVSPRGTVWPEGLAESRIVTVVVHTEAEGGSVGIVSLAGPEGWRVEPDSQPFELSTAGSQRSLSFQVTPLVSVPSGRHVFRATAVDADGVSYREGFSLIDYPHIERAALFAPAEVEVAVVPVRVREGLRVGYVMGTGDDGHEAIRQMGAEVEVLDEARVRGGDFNDLDVLVLGVRAYEARPDVRAANEQILDFARRGGVVINQYNQYQFSDGAYAPRRLVIGRPAPRVSVETQPVRILEPAAPLFTSPNRIDDRDFDDWVQERGLYFASEWDDGYVPLLEMSDPGEPAQLGSLLVTSVGEGVYAYVALSFFRQWSQRVPGAYRLFANLISLDPEEWKAFEAP
jgi:LmbE family N-acetylglucosaminyl deacetylase